MGRIIYHTSILVLGLTLTLASCSPSPSSGGGGGGRLPSGGSSDSSAIYVSPSGDDLAEGTKNAPLKTINAAITKTMFPGSPKTIYLASGIYNRGNGLSDTEESGVSISSLSGITIIGGWDSGFNNVVGYSELDGNNSLANIVYLRSANNIFIANLVIRRGNATNTSGGLNEERGGGIYIENADNITISNVILSNNVSYLGGGIYIEGGSNVRLVSINVSSNTAIASSLSIGRGEGGGIYLKRLTNSIIEVNLTRNYAQNRGGGIYITSSLGNTLNVNAISNNSGYEGGAIYADGSRNNTLNGTISFNRSGNGGGIFTYDFNTNTISLNVFSNISTNYGGGIGIEYSTSNVISGNIGWNSSGYGGGVAIHYDSVINTLNANVFSNISSSNGGGVYIGNQCRTNLILGNIYANFSTNRGGGIYIRVNGSANTISSRIYNNRANSGGGGGIYIFSEYGNLPIFISNSVLTNNTSGGINSVIHISNYTSLSVSLTIRGCYIGGDTSSTGIYEEGVNVTGHSLINNFFITNRLQNLYRDVNNNFAGINSISSVNNPSYSGASSASGNVTTNM